MATTTWARRSAPTRDSSSSTSRASPRGRSPSAGENSACWWTSPECSARSTMPSTRRCRRRARRRTRGSAGSAALRLRFSRGTATRSPGPPRGSCRRRRPRSRARCRSSSSTRPCTRSATSSTTGRPGSASPCADSLGCWRASAPHHEVETPAPPAAVGSGGLAPGARRLRRRSAGAWARHSGVQVRAYPRQRRPTAGAPALVRGQASGGARQGWGAAVDVGRPAPVLRDQPRGPERGVRRHDARLHLGTRVCPCRVAHRSDTLSLAGRARPVLREHGGRGEVRWACLGAALELQRRSPLLPHRPSGQVRTPPARDLRGARRSGPPHSRRGARSGARRLPLAGQTVRRAGRQRPRGALGERGQAPRRRRRGLSRSRAGGRCTPLPPRSHRDGSEPGLDDGRRRGALPASVRGRSRDLPAQLAVRAGPVRGQRLGGAREGGVRAAAGSRAGRAWRGLDGGRAPGRVPRQSAPGAGAGPGATPHDRARSAGDRARSRALPDAPGPLPRSGARAGSPDDATTADSGPGGSAAAGDAVLPPGLRDRPARVLGGARRGQVARAGDRRRRDQAQLLSRGAAMTRRQAADRRRALACLAPTVLALGALTVYPGVWVLWLSLHHRIPIFDVSRFAGLDNYAFLGVDSRFWNAAHTTAVFTLGSVALEVVLGVMAALAIHAQRRGRRLALSLLLLAWAMPAVVGAKLFEWLYHPTAGLINVTLGRHSANWLGDPGLALPAVILADVWRTMPFVAILCYARLMAVAAEGDEAGPGAGARPPPALTRITLPLLGRILLLAALFRTLDALRAFDIMFVLTGGGPAGTTETLTVYAYRALFQTLQLGFGSALSVVVFLLVMAVAWAYLKLLRAGTVAA